MSSVPDDSIDGNRRRSTCTVSLASSTANAGLLLNGNSTYSGGTSINFTAVNNTVLFPLYWNLRDAEGLTTGRLDTRFSGPDMDPLSKESDYDPQSAAISSAYVSAFNFKGGDQQQKVGSLSGGQRNRVHLAKLLKEGSNVLLLDEPTSQLDPDAAESFFDLVDHLPCAVLVSEPDRLASGIRFGAPALISQQALRATGLLEPGSLVRWLYRVVLQGTPASDAQIAALTKAAQTRFREAGWEVRTRNNISPQFSRNLDRFTEFLTSDGERRARKRASDT